MKINIDMFTTIFWRKDHIVHQHFTNELFLYAKTENPICNESVNFLTISTY